MRESGALALVEVDNPFIPIAFPTGQLKAICSTPSVWITGSGIFGDVQPWSADGAAGPRHVHRGVVVADAAAWLAPWPSA